MMKMGFIARGMSSEWEKQEHKYEGKPETLDEENNHGMDSDCY